LVLIAIACFVSRPLCGTAVVSALVLGLVVDVSRLRMGSDRLFVDFRDLSFDIGTFFLAVA
jgi:hypothetical protein